MMIILEIRSLAPDDWEVTRALRLNALRDSPDAFGGSYEATSKRPEEEWRVWPANGQPFAAILDGEPVGIACGVPTNDPDADELIAMWVDPRARGHKIGKALIDAIADWTKARGRKRLELGVFETNEPAYRSYLKAGFTVTGPSSHQPGALAMELSLPGDGS